MFVKPPSAVLLSVLGRDLPLPGPASVLMNSIPIVTQLDILNFAKKPKDAVAGGWNAGVLPRRPPLPGGNRILEMTNENFARLLRGLTIAVGNRRDRILLHRFLAAEI